MKTVRFSKVVQQCGEPEAYLLFDGPREGQDVSSGHESAAGDDRFSRSRWDENGPGRIGFHPGRSRQFLVFPKSLNLFIDCSVIGIKYDLLGSPEVPKGERATAPRPPKKPKPKTVPKARKEKTEPPPKPNVVAFRRPVEKEDEDADDEEIADLKKQVRHAMAVLEEGKAVAAFNLLKRIVE